MGKASHNHVHNDINVEPRDLTVSQARASSIALDVAAVCELLDDDMRAIARLIAHERSRADGLTVTLPCPAAQLRETLYHDADGLRIHTDTAGRTYITNLE